MMSSRARRRAAMALSFVVAATAATAAAVASAAVSIERVARAGQAAPGPGAAATFSGFGLPTINSDGTVLFLARTFDTSTGQFTPNNLYAGSAGGPATLVAGSGDTIPGGGATIAAIGSPLRYAIDDAGGVVFGAQLSTGFGLFAGPIGNLATVARSGIAAPGLPAGATYGMTQAPFGVLDAAGNVAFATTIAGGTGVSEAIYHGPIAAPQPFGRNGDPAAGLAAGPTYRIFDAPAMNRAGTVVWGAQLSGPGVESNYGGSIVRNDQAIYVGATSPTLVLRSGQQAVGRAAGVRVDGIGVRQIDDAGRIVFGAGLTEPNSTVPSVRGTIYDYTPASGLRALATENQPAPGLAGLTLLSIQAPVLGRGSDLAFQATLGGNVGASADTALYVTGDDAAAATLIARENGVVAGATGDVRWSGFDRVVVNAAGQVAFIAQLGGAAVTGANDRALFVYDPTLGTVLSIVREGDLLDTGFGLSAVTDIGFNDANLNDAAGPFAGGRLAFELSFAAGPSGIYVATIPEPTAFATVAAVVGLLVRRQRAAV